MRPSYWAPPTQSSKMAMQRPPPSDREFAFDPFNSLTTTPECTLKHFGLENGAERNSQKPYKTHKHHTLDFYTTLDVESSIINH